MSHRITPVLLAQLDRVRHDFAKAFQVLRDTRTLSATNTFQAYLRVRTAIW